jgi:hypothetical protein
MPANLEIPIQSLLRIKDSSKSSRSVSLLATPLTAHLLTPLAATAGLETAFSKPIRIADLDSISTKAQEEEEEEEM